MLTADLTQRILKAADVFRGRMDAAEYLRVISAALILRWAANLNRFDNLTVPPEARWDRLIVAANDSPRNAFDGAVTALAYHNPNIFDNSFRHMIRDVRLSDVGVQSLIAVLDEVDLEEENSQYDDVAGQVYDRILVTLADESRRGDGSTPRPMAQLMAWLAAPQAGQSVYDPCSGTGGLLIAAEAHLAERTGKRGGLHLYGQELNAQTCTVARLNLIMHGIPNASMLFGDSITNPSHLDLAGKLKRFDRVLTNPPFGVRRYGKEDTLFPEQSSYGWSQSADLMFVQHVLASLAPAGIGVMVVPNGVLFRGGAEGRIRQRMVKDGRIAGVIAMGRGLFRSTSVPASLLVLRGEDAARASKRDVLFINAEHEVDVTRSRTHLAPRHVEKIANTFHGRRETDYFSRLVSLDKITANEFSLSVGDYIHSWPQSRARLSTGALLKGGVPVDEVDAQRDRFGKFEIDIADLFVPGRPGYLDFARHRYGTISETISALAAPSVTAFLTIVGSWFQDFQHELGALIDRPPAASRNYFGARFHEALRASKILRSEEIAGLFADWWVANRDDLYQLRMSATESSMLGPGVRATALKRIGADLTARAERLVAHQQQHLVDVYQAWADQYKTSLADLEDRREVVSRRLAERLNELGYQ